MWRIITFAALTCMVPLLAVGIEAPHAPPSPYPTIPPASQLPEAIPRAPVTAKAARKKPSRPKIRLGEKCETDNSGGSGPGQNTPAKAEVKAQRDKLTARLTGSASSHCFFGVPSLSVESIQVVQQFDIVTDPAVDPRVELSLSGKIDGYLRSELKSSASLRLADAVISLEGGPPLLSLVFPPRCASGTASERCEGRTDSPPLTVAAGRYVLVLNLVLETSAENLFRGHAEAVFAPGRRQGTWTSSVENPFEDVEGEDFGFAVSVKVGLLRPE